MSHEGAGGESAKDPRQRVVDVIALAIRGISIGPVGV